MISDCIRTMAEVAKDLRDEVGGEIALAGEQYGLDFTEVLLKIGKLAGKLELRASVEQRRDRREKRRMIRKALTLHERNMED